MPTKPKSTPLTLPDGTVIQIGVETITPDEARAMLATNTHNRKPRKRHVDILAKEILSGEWKLTHQGIAFSAPAEDGTSTLIDGQHRLLAIAAAERPATLLVSRGWPMATQEAADMGTARSVAEALQLYDGVKSANKTCAYLNVVAREWAGYGFKVSLPQSREMLRLFHRLPELAAFNLGSYPSCYTSTGALAITAIGMHRWKKTAVEFGDSYLRGIGLTETHPAYHLRAYCAKLMGEVGLSGYKPTSLIFSYAADCFQAHIEGKAVNIARPTKTGKEWLRTEMGDAYSQLRSILKLS